MNKCHWYSRTCAGENEANGGSGVDLWRAWWNFVQMNAIATCDEKHRLVIPDAVPGKQYLVQGLSLKPVEEPKPAEPQRVVYGRLVEKDGVCTVDFGEELPDEELGKAIVKALREQREEIS